MPLHGQHVGRFPRSHDAEITASQGFRGHSRRRFEDVDGRQANALDGEHEIAGLIGKGAEGHPGIAPSDELHPLRNQAPHPIETRGLPREV